MRIVVNGEEQTVAAGTTVEAVVSRLAGAAERGVAVAVDRVVVPRESWSETVVEEGQELEVLRAVAGG